ncbi:GAF domain-containing protein [Streptomyces sp. SID8352]|uniref:GAF domain-containing protein n=1 Tax=Streptomyces sp. SID8352 TaxID=2690338 RepID=UPI001368D2DE|nr:GAF domain-containing protein [Streptomyces sp. SID8352]MYU21043.1 GAF domain-containing protein [Streptomyces sp. SID8352]
MTLPIGPATAPTPDGPGEDASVRELLQSVVDVARAIFGAGASSVLLLDDGTQELVFQAVSGQGEEFLTGRRFPAGRGIAGWVAMSGESVIVDDLARDSSFDRALAESTAYVPDALMAAPLLHDDRVLGVLEVLDPAPQARSSLSELDLLSLFARQAAAALRIAIDRRPRAPRRGGLAGDQRAAAVRLMTELERLLADADA